MIKKIFIFVGILVPAILIDQYIKNIFVNGFEEHFECISLILAYNKGVAFSMFWQLGDSLKYIQIGLLFALSIYFIYDKDFIKRYFVAMAFIMGGGISNIIDRFMHEGVVDFVYWHCGFDFAIFNTADIFINIGAFLIILSFVLDYVKERKQKNAK